MNLVVEKKPLVWLHELKPWFAVSAITDLILDQYRPPAEQYGLINGRMVTLDGRHRLVSAGIDGYWAVEVEILAASYSSNHSLSCGSTGISELVFIFVLLRATHLARFMVMTRCWAVGEQTLEVSLDCGPSPCWGVPWISLCCECVCLSVVLFSP